MPVIAARPPRTMGVLELSPVTWPNSCENSGHWVQWSFLAAEHACVPGGVTHLDFTGKRGPQLCLEPSKSLPLCLFVWIIGLYSLSYNCNYKYCTLLSSVSHSWASWNLTVVIRTPKSVAIWSDMQVTGWPLSWLASEEKAGLARTEPWICGLTLC